MNDEERDTQYSNSEYDYVSDVSQQEPLYVDNSVADEEMFNYDFENIGYSYNPQNCDVYSNPQYANYYDDTTTIVVKFMPYYYSDINIADPPPQMERQTMEEFEGEVQEQDGFEFATEVEFDMNTDTVPYLCNKMILGLPEPAFDVVTNVYEQYEAVEDYGEHENEIEQEYYDPEEDPSAGHCENYRYY